ncbi:MAG: sigma-70 family RNA polymerase sigma factor [Planctomycetes bacterium]|nr:sigma-70 family RNA polymerase sigma factor [Planctomycetota bacterium]
MQPISSLERASSEQWNRLIESVGPAAMLLVVRARMSPAMLARLAPEDVWQETLLHAWRDRTQCTWQGLPAFRRWLISILEHRLLDLAEAAERKKRGGGAQPLSLDARAAPAEASSLGFAGPIASTTPSRVAMDREAATAIAEALQELPEELREVVRLRLIEDLSMPEVAERTGLGLSAAQHRFRKGAESYQRALARRLRGDSRVG